MRWICKAAQTWDGTPACSDESVGNSPIFRIRTTTCFSACDTEAVMCFVVMDQLLSSERLGMTLEELRLRMWYSVTQPSQSMPRFTSSIRMLRSDYDIVERDHPYLFIMALSSSC